MIDCLAMSLPCEEVEDSVMDWDRMRDEAVEIQWLW